MSSNTLPEVVDSTGWQWRPFKPPRHGDGFWIGTDPAGVDWVAKMRGSFYGYRELVFERLVQKAGWPCLVSAFSVLDRHAPPVAAGEKVERTQLVSRYVPEHAYAACGAGCPREAARLDQKRTGDDVLDVLLRSGIRAAANVARCYILAPVLGGLEPADWLLSTDHEAVLIDGECMFSGPPSDPRATQWWTRDDGSPSMAGQRLTYEVCAFIGGLSGEELKAALAIPAGIKVKSLWSIRKILIAARNAARKFAQTATRGDVSH